MADFGIGEGIMVASLAASAAGGAATAAGTLAGGSLAKTAANYKADQLEQNAAGELAAGQRRMLDKQYQTKMLESTTVARASASGAAPDVGSAVSDVGEIAKRGEFQSLMDLWQGENAATGMRNQAKALRYTGSAEEAASYLAASGTIASTAGSMLKTYGAFEYPTARGAAGTSV